MEGSLDVGQMTLKLISSQWQTRETIRKAETQSGHKSHPQWATHNHEGAQHLELLLENQKVHIHVWHPNFKDICITSEGGRLTSFPLAWSRGEDVSGVVTPILPQVACESE